MEKLLIGSLELDNTQTGKPVVELYSTNTALQFPELRLFDLSALLAVGIDPNALTPGVRVHKRFWAYYTLSDKTNQRGNPYRDVAHLETIDQPATTTSTDTSQLLAELRAMNALLLTIAEAVGADKDAPPPAAHADPVQAAIVGALTGKTPAETAESIKALPIHDHYRYANGIACSTNEHERNAFDAFLTAENARPQDVDQLREWVRSTPAPRQD